MFRKFIHSLLLFIMKFTYQYEIRVLNAPPEVSENAIYAVNHSCCHDVPIACNVIRKHTYILAGKQRLKMLDWLAFTLNGVVWVDRIDKESKRRASMKMQRLLKRGENIAMYPEGTWNLTPSKPILPLYWGIIDVARGNVPIIPLVLEYRENICYVKFGQAVTIREQDKKQEKINELEDVFATLKWEIWEMLPVEHRSEGMREQWEVEVQRRLTEYSLLDYEFEKGIVRSRDYFPNKFP